MFLKNLYLVILLGLFSFSLYAGDKLVLLTSLDPNLNRPVLRSRKWDITKKLEKIFYDKLTPYHTSISNLKVIHFATIEDLTRELASPENKAVFWVSHSNGGNADPTFNENIVVDYKGFDITEGFQEPSSQLQYLGLVGCRARFLIEKNITNGHMLNNESLVINAGVKKVDARRALKYAIGNYLYHYYHKSLSSSDQLCKEVERKTIKITRKIPNNPLADGKVLSSVKVLQRGRLIGLFPESKLGETQSIEVDLIPGVRAIDYKLVFDSGIASEDVVMGNFEIVNAKYQVFSTRSGRILGKGRYVYNYKGNLEELPQSEIKNNMNCIN